VGERADDVRDVAKKELVLRANISALEEQVEVPVEGGDHRVSHPSDLQKKVNETGAGG